MDNIISQLRSDAKMFGASWAVATCSTALALALTGQRVSVDFHDSVAAQVVNIKVAQSQGELDAHKLQRSMRELID